MSAPRPVDRTDLVLGIVALAGAAGYLYEAAQIPESLLADPVNAKGLPIAVGCGLTVLGLILCLRGGLVRTLFRARIGAGAAPPIDREEAPRAMRRHFAALGLLVILALYVVVLPCAGYVVSTALLIGAVAGVSGAAFDRNLPLIAVAGSVVLWLLFDPLLGISLPLGSWWQGR